MSGLAIAALTLVCVWLAVLTLAVVLLVRQIGLLTVRLSLANQAISLEEEDGLAAGEPIPEEVLAAVPELGGEQKKLPLTPFGDLRTLSGDRGRADGAQVRCRRDSHDTG